MNDVFSFRDGWIMDEARASKVAQIKQQKAKG
jgi:hypothetical protein